MNRERGRPAPQGSPQSFKVFLSHRYKSAETNLQFFNLFNDLGAEVQFKVDEGSKRISMTRLERMVRDADAFVGYREDIHDWHDVDSLGAAVRDAYAAIDREEAYIGSAAEAKRHFSRAEKRKEEVFLSYSGEDRATVAPIADILEQRFQKIHDYRRASIPVGSKWYDEIIRQFSTSPLGIPLLSASYLTKPYCLEETERMATRQVEGKMTVLPVNLDIARLPPDR